MKSLSDICELVVDCEHKTAPTQEQGYPSIRTPNIGRGYFILNGVNRVSEETYKLWTRRATPQGGDLILAREAPVGNVAVIPEGEQYCLGQRTVLIRPKKDIIEPNYLCFLLLSPGIQGELLGKSSGATVHHLNIKDIRALRLPNLPSLKKQKQISLTIKRYDELIATNQRRIVLLEEAARLIYREWFVHMRFPGHESTHIHTGIPEGWKAGSAHEFINILSGGTPKTSVNNYWNGDIPFFTPKDSPNCFYTTDTEKSLTSEGLNNCNSRLFPNETIFITARGTVGKTALSGRPMAMNQSCYALTPKEGIGNLFLFMAIRESISRLQKAANGGVFNAIVVDTFKNIPFLLPKPELTLAFDDKVRPLFEQVLTLIQQNRILAQTRDLLLPKLMSGQIDVSNIQLPDEDVVT